MPSEAIILQPDAKALFTLSSVAQTDVQKVDVVDVDIIVTLKNGGRYLLPDAGISAMGDKPPYIAFADGNVSVVTLLNQVGAIQNPTIDAEMLSSLDLGKSPTERPDAEDLERAKSEIARQEKMAAEKLQKAEQELNNIKEEQKQVENQKEELQKLQQQIEEQQKKQAAKEELDAARQSQVSELTENTEMTVEQMVKNVEKIEENLHKSDYDYVPPSPFQTSQAPLASPPGVPPPISLTPVVNIYMGNVVGTVEETIAGIHYFYGGGGAIATEAEQKLGPRNPLQFSPATITGTSGDDVIYTNGPLVGNASPSVNPALGTDSRVYNAKEIQLTVAGYFTSLNDVIIRGVPTGVSIAGATDSGGGTWVLPASYAVHQNPFKIAYDMNVWRASGSDTFDLHFDISGATTRNVNFETTQTFRFQFMDVTTVSQITDPMLAYDDNGISRQIYVLPTLSQPNIINSGEGNDTIYGGLNVDTITVGSGNNTVHAAAGDNAVVAGNGNNVITALNGNNIVQVGSGSNQITLGDGNNTVSAGSGNNAINVGDGSNTVTVGGGTNSITAGDGNNTLVGGSGNDTMVAGNGNNTFKLGAGTNSVTAGTGSNTLDLTDMAVVMSVNLASGTATGTGVSDSFSGINNVRANDLGATIVGNASYNILTGGSGNDSITAGNGGSTIYGNGGDDIIRGGTGADALYGGSGNNTLYTGTAGADVLYGGSGNNIFISQHAGVTYDGTNGANLSTGQVNRIDYSASSAAMNINLLSGFGAGGLAEGDIYRFTPIQGINSINGLTTGSGSDTITDSKADDTINAGNGNNSFYIGTGNDSFTSGTGTDYFYAHNGGLTTDNKTYSGGTGANYLYMGKGRETIVYTGGYDIVINYYSPAGILANLDSVSHSVRNSLGTTITVSALSGSGWGVTTADASTYSLGDTYSVTSAIYGSGTNDVVWGAANGLSFFGYYGLDYFFGGSGNDFVYLSDNDRIDGGSGSNTCYANNGWNTTGNAIIYLDGTADTNGNGVADYTDNGISSLTISAASSPTGSAISYAGFVLGLGGTGYLSSVQNILGYTGNDLLVGDGNNNILNAQTGQNTIYGLGGNDSIYCTVGVNTINGGSGTDTVFFDNSWYSTASTGAQVFLADGSFAAASDKIALWGATYSTFQARTGATGVYGYNAITGVENITGSGYSDVLYGDSGANVITGNGGGDIIAGMGGADTLTGGSGSDTFRERLSDLATVTAINGVSGADTLLVAGNSGYQSNNSFAADTFRAVYTNINTVDARNGNSGNTFGMNANDILHLANGSSTSTNTVTLRLDTGDTFTAATGAGTGALSVVQSGSTYNYYADLGNTTLVSVLHVQVG